MIAECVSTRSDNCRVCLNCMIDFILSVLEILSISTFPLLIDHQLVCSHLPNLNLLGNGSLSLCRRINEWNTALEAKVAQKRTAEVAIELYDAAKLFSQVLDNPVKYGFKDAISAGDSEDYIWRDILHPTTAMHKVIAADFAKFLAKGEDDSQEKSGNIFSKI